MALQAPRETTLAGGHPPEAGIDRGDECRHGRRPCCPGQYCRETTTGRNRLIAEDVYVGAARVRRSWFVRPTA
jgi:hypothetical protein